MNLLQQQNLLRSLLLLTFINTFNFISCKTLDTSQKSENSIEQNYTDDFFKNPNNISSQVKKIIEEIKIRNNKKEFINSFASNYGIPVWNKALELKKSNSSTNFSSNNSTTTNDTIVFIPLVLTNQNVVNGFIKAVISDSIYLSYSLAKDYQNYPFTNSGSQITANQFSSVMMYLDKSVFGRNEFTIKDKRLFNNIGNTTDTAKTRRTVTISDAPSTTNLLETLCYTSTIMNIIVDMHCTNTGDCENGPCDMCSACVDISSNSNSETSCSLVEVGGVGSGGGSSGGGGSITPSYPCTNASIPFSGGNTINSITGNPLPPCPPPTGSAGWTPIVTPLGDILINPCDPYITALQDNANFAEKFIALGTSSNINLTFEKGYVVNNIASNNYSGLLTGITTSLGGAIDFGAYSGYEGTLHTHYNGLQEMFSPTDITAFAKAFLNNQTSSLQNLFQGVATASGPYLMKITDTAKFRVFANRIAGSPEKEGNFVEKNIANFLYMGNKNENEKEFLQMMLNEKVKGAFTLYRGYANCNKWTALSLESINNFSGPPTIRVKDKDCF